MLRNSSPSNRSERVFGLGTSVPGGPEGGTVWPRAADDVRNHPRRTTAGQDACRGLMAFLSRVGLGSNRIESIRQRSEGFEGRTRTLSIRPDGGGSEQTHPPAAWP